MIFSSFLGRFGLQGLFKKFFFILERDSCFTLLFWFYVSVFVFILWLFLVVPQVDL